MNNFFDGAIVLPAILSPGIKASYDIFIVLQL